MPQLCYIMLKVRETMAVPKYKRGGKSRSGSGVVLRRGDCLAAAGGDGAIGGRIDGPSGLAGRCGPTCCPLDTPLRSPHTLPRSILASRRCLVRSYLVATSIY